MLRVHRYLAALILATSFVAFPAASFAGVFVGIGIGGGGIGLSIGFAPPELPVYEQPPCSVPDTIWTPGYWAYGPYGYYWVPGAWVEAPEVGYLWTPGYWGYDDGDYAWHGGYWGRHVGFYGGVNYGFGYGGNGYDGGGWNGDHFRYNTAYTNVNRTTIENVYINRTVVNNYGNTYNRTSYNGGERGLRTRPTAGEIAFRNERHLEPTQVQRQHIETAAQNRNFLATVNHGRPSHAAVTSPLSRENRPAGFSPVTAADRREIASRATATAARFGESRSATDPFSRFDRNSPSYANRTLGVANESSRFERAKSPATDPYSRFDRNTPSYARAATREANAPSRYGESRSTAIDPYSRFDRSATTRPRNENTYSRDTNYSRNAGSYQTQAANRPERSYGEPRGANVYRPQASRPERSYGEPRGANVYRPQASHPERSYGAPASRYRAEPTYRSHAAPNIERPAERSRPVERSRPAAPAEPHRSEPHREH